jgi:hypothetical protein
MLYHLAYPMGFIQIFGEDYGEQPIPALCTGGQAVEVLTDSP